MQRFKVIHKRCVFVLLAAFTSVGWVQECGGGRREALGNDRICVFEQIGCRDRAPVGI